MSKRLDTVKLQGAQAALRKEISDLIWDVKTALENAPKDNYKDFKKQLASAKKNIQAIEETFEELLK